MKISACMIVKNEENNIQRCIESFKSAVDEIIVVDTGSEDKTIDIAKKLDAKVFSYMWKDDFAAARNYALDKANYEWIIFLDADEYFEKGVELNIRKIIEKVDGEPKYDCISSRMINIDEISNAIQEEIIVIRIFRNKKTIKYINKIHECIINTNNKPIVSLTGFEEQLLIKHTGYSENLVGGKSIRNIKLLLKELETSSSKDMIYFYLVSCYTSCKDYDNAIKYAKLFINSGKIVENYENYIPQQLLLSMLKRNDNVEDILEETNKYIERFPKNHAFVNIAASIYKSQKKYEKALEYYLKTIDYKINFKGNEYFCEITSNENLYIYIGMIYELKNDTEKAVEYYVKALVENKKSDALTKLMVLIRQERPEEIIYLLNSIYDINLKDDIKYLVDVLASLKYGKVLLYYHNIWINKFKEEDAAAIFTLIANGNFGEAFKLLYKCFKEEKNDWDEKFLVIAALLSNNDENVDNIKGEVREVYRKIIECYSGYNQSIVFVESETNIFLDLINEFILASETNEQLEKLIKIKYKLKNNISNYIGDILKKWRIYDWALEEYKEFVDDINNSYKADAYFDAGDCSYKMGDYENALEFFKNALKYGYMQYDIYEYANWIVTSSQDEQIIKKAKEILNYKKRIVAINKNLSLNYSKSKDTLKYKNKIVVLNSGFYNFIPVIINKNRCEIVATIKNVNEISNYEFDYLIDCDGSSETEMKKKNADKNKIINFRRWFFQFFDYEFYRTNYNYIDSKRDFEGIITGISYHEVGINTKCLDNKFFNFSISGEDLFYNYKRAEQFISENKNHTIKYAVLGLSYYSFQYDLSKSQNDFGKYRANIYYPFYNTMHNYKHKSEAINFYNNFKDISEILFLDNYERIIYEMIRAEISCKWDQMVNNVFDVSNFSKEEANFEINKIKSDGNKNYPLTVSENIDIFSKYLNLLKNNGIKPYIVICPVTDFYRKYFPERLKKEFYEIINNLKKNFEYQVLDFYDSTFFSYKDFYDSSHLNAGGAIKFTTILNELLK